WMMLLAYFIVCPWEAVALGKLAAYIFPALDVVELYRVAGQPVFLPRLALGIVLTLFLAMLNYRGIRLSATFQRIITSTVLLCFLVIAALSASRGKPANLYPAFSAAPLASILLTLQIVPYFMTGFESVPKYAEESDPAVRPWSFALALWVGLGLWALFYAVSIASVSYAVPWRGLVGKRFATAIAFEGSDGTHWPVRLILAMATFGLFQCFNGNFA